MFHIQTLEQNFVIPQILKKTSGPGNLENEYSTIPPNKYEKVSCKSILIL